MTTSSSTTTTTTNNKSTTHRRSRCFHRLGWLLGLILVNSFWRSSSTLQQIFSSVVLSPTYYDESTINITSTDNISFVSSVSHHLETVSSSLLDYWGQEQEQQEHEPKEITPDVAVSKEKEDQPIFASCLMVMDENHRLPEWLAYHYYMLPLKHVILLVDPRSEQSPMEIVNRWRSLMTIHVWNHSHVLEMNKRQRTRPVAPAVKRTTGSSSTNGTIHRRKTNNRKKKNSQGRRRRRLQEQATATTINITDVDTSTLTKIHRTMQPLFYRTCGTALQRYYSNQGKAAWLTYHDVDEYLYLNPEHVPNAHQRMSQPASIRTYIQDMIQFYHQQLQQQAQEQVGQPQPSSSDTDTATTAATRTASLFYQTDQDNHRNTSAVFKFANQSLTGQCWVVERTYFGATEEENVPKQDDDNDIPYSMVDRSNYETLRDVYRTSHKDYENNGPPKVITLFGGIYPPATETLADLQPAWKLTVHRVLYTCPGVGGVPFFPIRIRHYLGSWKVYTSRVDARMGTSRSREHYLYRSEKSTIFDNDIHGWLSGFYQQLVSLQQPQQPQQQVLSLFQSLLQGVGEVNTSLATEPAPTNISNLLLSPPSPWSLSPSYIQNMINKNNAPLARWLRKRLEVVPVSHNGTNATTEVTYEVKLRQPAA